MSNRLTLDGHTNIWVYDLEVFPNFFLCSAWDGEEWFETSHIPTFQKWLLDRTRILIGFNSFSYDDIIAKFIVENPTCSPSDIFKLSLMIITGEGAGKTVFQMQYAKTAWKFSIDIFQLLNKRGALKEWECRQGADIVMESPHDFLKDLPLDAQDDIAVYCRNDVRESYRLVKKIWHLVTLRAELIKQYDLGTRPYVLSEAGVAQHVLMTINQQRTGQYVNRVRSAAKENKDNLQTKWAMTDIVFKHVAFKTAGFRDMFKRFMKTHAVGDARGISWKIADPFFKDFVELGDKSYQLGVGGLHSDDEPGIWVSNNKNTIIDLDVESYYPSIMIEHKLTPKHLGQGFIKDFTEIRDKRLKAKHSGDKGTNEALKIVINSTFGKLNDYYSPLRSVPDALRVTINGQLMLLMLIEMLEMKGFVILSANTDGVTIISPTVAGINFKLKMVISEWEKLTKFKLEEAIYTRYCRRDINAYLAIKPDGKIKEKGVFTEHPDKGKWDGMVVKKAAREYLLRDIDPKDTVYAETDARQFLYYQRVGNGGYAALGDQKIGKTIRWYVAKKGKQVVRVNPPGSKAKQAKIPNGEAAQLALDITDWDILGIPTDINRDHYVHEAWELIKTTQPKVKKK